MNQQAEVDMSPTIIAKSDQSNADDFLAGPETVTITGVSKSSTAEQPITIQISGGRQPFKPCKTIRRVLVAAWGKDGSKYVGKSMTLYRDPDVKWAGEAVGGIRISHMSGLTKPLEISLAESRKSKKKIIVQPLVMKPPVSQMKDTLTSLKQRWKSAYESIGADVTPEAFRQWLSDSTDGTVDAKDAMNPDKYTEAMIEQCEDALRRMEPSTPNDADTF